MTQEQTNKIKNMIKAYLLEKNTTWKMMSKELGISASAKGAWVKNPMSEQSAFTILKFLGVITSAENFIMWKKNNA